MLFLIFRFQMSLPKQFFVNFEEFLVPQNRPEAALRYLQAHFELSLMYP